MEREREDGSRSYVNRQLMVKATEAHAHKQNQAEEREREIDRV